MRVTIELQELDSGHLADCAAEALTERRVRNALNKSREGLKWFLVKSVNAVRVEFPEDMDALRKTVPNPEWAP